MIQKDFEILKASLTVLDPYGEENWHINTMDIDDLTMQLAKFRQEINSLSIKTRSWSYFEQRSATRRMKVLTERIPWIEQMLRKVCEETVIDFQI